MIKSENAIILCSGGIDSVVTSFYVKGTRKYKKIKIIFFNYGQKSLAQERRCSNLCARRINANFIEINIPELAKLSNSLINKRGKITKMTRKDLKDTKKESEKYYVPNRNSIFISYALALAESFNSKTDIFLGFKCEGKESYPDTTQEFVNSVNDLIRSQGLAHKVIAPLIKMDKEDIIVLGSKLGVNFKDTFSCYVGNNLHCGRCLACMLRKEGFYWANIQDPTGYLKD